MSLYDDVKKEINIFISSLEVDQKILALIFIHEFLEKDQITLMRLKAQLQLSSCLRKHTNSDNETKLLAVSDLVDKQNSEVQNGGDHRDLLLHAMKFIFPRVVGFTPLRDDE